MDFFQPKPEHNRVTRQAILAICRIPHDCDSEISHQPGHIFLGTALQSETSPTKSFVPPSLLHDLKTFPRLCLLALPTIYFLVGLNYISGKPEELWKKGSSFPPATRMFSKYTNGLQNYFFMFNTMKVTC